LPAEAGPAGVLAGIRKGTWVTVNGSCSESAPSFSQTVYSLTTFQVTGGAALRADNGLPFAALLARSERARTLESLKRSFDSE
jgi:hypothetical protein